MRFSTYITIVIIFLIAPHYLIAQTVDVSYLSPQLGTSGTYEFYRFGTSSNYFAGFMWNESSANFGDGDDFSIFTYNNRDLTFRTGTGNFIVFPTASVGNVGIGTTSPTAKLDVSGNIKATDQIVVNKNGSYRLALNGSSDGYIRGRNDSAEDKFQITSNGISYFNGGEVGIGTATPQTELHVAGLGRTGIRVGGPASSGGAIADLEFRPSDGQGVGGSNFWIWSFRTDSWSSTPGDFVLYSHDGTGYTSPIIVQPDGDVALVSGNNAARNGNVGIGTTSPDAKLAVNGNIHAKEVKVDLIGWPDYVFEEAYDLPSLEEVQEHIVKNGHLINMPSAKVVEENGLRLGEMDKLLLEKIEELTLYVIELKNENKAQQQLIEELKTKIQ